METVKAASYWFDKRHDVAATAGTVANVGLSLMRDAFNVLEYDWDADDNKAFIHHHTTSMPSELRLQIIGRDVAGHDFGCGNDSIMVHTVIFIEYSDRENPTYNAATGEGIAPENI